MTRRLYEQLGQIIIPLNKFVLKMKPTCRYSGIAKAMIEDMGSEKVFLQWQQFQTSLVSSFQNLCNTADFSDVTLICEDGQQIEAHKIVLASSSTFFRRLLQNNSSHHPHPLVFMRGISYTTLSALMDFVYRGEVEVLATEVDELLKVATLLGLKGLGRQEQEKAGELERVGLSEAENEDENKSARAALEGRLEGLADLNSQLLEKLPRDPMDEITMSESPKVQYTCEQCDKHCRTVASLKRHTKIHIQESHEDYDHPPSDANTVSEEISSTSGLVEYNSGDGEDLKTKIEALTGYIPDSGLWSCRQCGKTFKYKFNLRRHAEIHIDGFTNSCGTCGKTCSTRSKLRNHISRRHPAVEESEMLLRQKLEREKAEQMKEAEVVFLILTNCYKTEI